MRLVPARAPRRISRAVWLALVVGGLGAGYLLVWWAGGTKSALPHVMYFPIVLAAFLSGSRAGALAGAAAGLLLGPLMPLDVTSGQGQALTGWVIRMGFFIGVGWVVGEGRRQLMRMAESRQRFVSAISHELRTPLAGALGFSKLLAEQQGELSAEEVREFADLIHREMNLLSDVVDGYLISARFDDSALIIEPRDVELHRLVTQVMDELPAALRTGRVSVTAHPTVAWGGPAAGAAGAPERAGALAGGRVLSSGDHHAGESPLGEGGVPCRRLRAPDRGHRRRLHSGGAAAGYH